MPQTKRMSPEKSDTAAAPVHVQPMKKAKTERKHWPRQTAIKSDISVHPERDGNDPANDPCAGCEHMVCVCGELLDWDE